jgi:DNA repair protein RecO (recombination protein O)
VEWRDQAIVVSARRHGENALVVHVMTEHHGRHAGLAPGGASRRRRGVFQPGNRIDCRWRARLEEHLGTLSAELVRAHAAPLLDQPPRLAGLAAACALVDAALPEREPHPGVYRALVALLEALGDERRTEKEWGAAYVGWELGLLGELGFGLDLSACAATGTADDLVWVSPRSGRAVSAEAGARYRDRLLPLPAFLSRGATPRAAAEVVAGLGLTGHFLSRHGLMRAEGSLPAARDRLVEAFKRMARDER